VTTHRFVLALIASLAISGCAGDGCNAGDGDGGPSNDRVVQHLPVDFDQHTVYPSSVLTFRMKGSDRMVPGGAQVLFQGEHGTGKKVDLQIPVIPEEDGFPRVDGDQGDVLVKLPVEQKLWDAIGPSPNAVYDGTIEIHLVDEIGELAEGRLGGVHLEFQTDATPTVSTVPSGQYYVNQTIDVTGENFLQPEEGTVYGVVDGTMTYPDDATKPISGAKVPLTYVGRTKAKFPIDARVFGVRIGSFSGSVHFESELRTGQTFDGNAQDSLEVDLQQTFLAALDPSSGSRGQKIELQGRGFVPTDDEAGLGMILQFDGTFQADAGGEPVEVKSPAFDRAPDHVSSDERAELAVWYEIVDGGLEGLGANPGTFTGTITPVLFDRNSEQVGVAWEGTFRVQPTKQVVYTKYLPGFSKGLEKYGLQNVEFDIRKRILEVTNRDYAEFNVEFVDEPPTDFIDYATIEVGGPDPTGGNKFGYDNTCNVQADRCKDTDNLYLSDYLGGINANSASTFNTPFGGVFIESFDFFSPTLNPDSPAGSSEFDAIMSPFMPGLGGSPVKGTEWPDGPRHDAIALAIHMVGSVIGNTCSHEVGHSLGLSFFPEDRIHPTNAFHNKIPCENCMMDPGSERPFEERAEIDGKGPATFNDRNTAYLKEILPLPK